MPTIVSFIFTPPDPYDLEDEHAALQQTTDRDPVGNRVEGKLDGG
jgi:hypothetical protein